ncbi:arsenate reductase [Dermatophilus congolensis]|uniref:Arsenate reductase n=2 Tax=Dermatophilus congolensis TaxID=1863 RepID=A0AA46BNV0_9MICO|nr:arsenate reductase [Dermatophilus congolensis]
MTMEITILHNPRCSTSRAALTELENASIKHDIICYLDTPLNEQDALDLLNKLEDAPADLIRRDNTFTQLGLTDNDIDTAQKVAALIAKHPALMQRPVLIAANRAIIGRPKDRVPAFITEITQA